MRWATAGDHPQHLTTERAVALGFIATDGIYFPNDAGGVAIHCPWAGMSFAVFSFKFNSKKTKRVCSDCHQRKGCLDVAALGFQPQRVVDLNSSEVVGLIDK